MITSRPDFGRPDHSPRPMRPGGPTATSIDGRSFTCDGSAPYVPGDLVVLQPRHLETRLGLLTEALSGELVAELAADGTTRRTFVSASFVDAPVEPVRAEHLVRLQREEGAALPIGVWSMTGVEAPANLRTQGLASHTLLCGRSGSGTEKALDVLLRAVLLGTDIRMVILNSSAAQVRLDRNKPRWWPADKAESLASREVEVIGATSTGLAALRRRFTTLPGRHQARILGLDPLDDLEEFNLFLRQSRGDGSRDLGTLLRRFRRGDAVERSLAQRIEGFELLDREVAAADPPAAVPAPSPRVSVVDLAGFADLRARNALGLVVIEDLWEQRQSRKPTIIVVDEAHNFCPADPVGPVQEASVERLIQIARFGRRYGLGLLLSTEWPSMLHRQVLSECDNLVMMRMSSPAFVTELAEIFGSAPPAMFRAALQLVRGDALVAGEFVPLPAFVRIPGGRPARRPSAPPQPA
jgi:uncharacterized protein